MATPIATIGTPKRRRTKRGVVNVPHQPDRSAAIGRARAHAVLAGGAKKKAAPKAQAAPRRGGLSGQQMRALYFGEGGDPRSVWNKATHGQKARIARQARTDGVTIAGWIKGGPKYLRERSAGGLRRTAERTIRQAYGAEDQALSDREGKIHNLREKRMQDQAYYDQWLTSRSAEMEAQAQSADKLVLDSVQKEKDLQAASYQGAGQTAAADVAGAEGSAALPNSNTQSLDQRVGESKTRADVALEAQRGRIQTTVASGASRRSANAQANVAIGQQRRMKFDSDMNDNLTELEHDRKVLAKQKAGDIAKEVARLQTEELTKATGARDYGLAAQKLGVDAADKAAKRRIAKGKLKLDKGKLGLDTKKYKETQRKNKADERIKKIDAQLKSKTLSETERHNLASEKAALINATKPAKGKSSSGPGGDRTSNGKLWNDILYIQSQGKNASPTKEYRQNPKLRKAAIQRLGPHKAVDPALAREIKQIYGINLKVYHPTKKRRGDRAGGRR